MNTDHLPTRIADALLARADRSELERVYWEAQQEWAETLTEDELREVARRLDIPEEAEPLPPTRPLTDTERAVLWGMLP